MSQNAQWMQRDLDVLWHPCTQMKDHERLPLIPIKRGEGVWLEDFDGKRYLDAVSSWWVNVFGHGNPRINQRIREQLDSLEHVMLAGFTHEPVVELSERLVQITPAGLDKVFYADNGSSGIEVALKMSHHYWINNGQPGKKRFVTLTNSYHGETVAAMSVGDVALFTDTYKALLLDTLKVPSPDCYLRPEGMGWEEHSRNMFAAMEQTLAEHHRRDLVVMLGQGLFHGGEHIARMFLPAHPFRAQVAVRAGHLEGVEQQRLVGVGEQRHVAHRHRCHGFAVVAVAQGDEAFLARLAAVDPVVMAHLQRHLDAGRTVVGVEHLVQPGRGDLHQALGQLHRRRMGEAGEHYVFQAVELLADALVDARIAVAEHVDPPGTDRIQIAFAVEVLQPHAVAAPDRDQRQALVVFHLGARVPQHVEVALHPLGILAHAGSPV